eukprot:scaffold24496_cov80-Skeletonema_marinoi.AAC.1
MAIFRNRLIRCTMPMHVNRYIFHNTATTAITTRQFSGLLWQQLDHFSSSEQTALPCTTMKEGKACTCTCKLYGFVAHARRRRSLPAPAHTITSNSGEETDNEALENQFRLNITYPWIAHRGME